MSTTPTTTPIYRVRILQDDDYTAETPEGVPLPGTQADYERSPIMRLVTPGDDPVTGARRAATWEEYLAYEGDPDQQIGLAVVVDRQCPCCQQWQKGVEALWGIGYFNSSPEVRAIGRTVAEGDIDSLPGYLQEVATDLLREAREATDAGAPAADGGTR